MPAAYERPEGVTEKEWQMFLDDIQRHDEALQKLVCPDCGGPLTKKLDPRQGGATIVVGTWFNYRCVGCKFFMDQCEPE